MDRRLAGVVVLVLALLAASAVPALSGRRVVGAAMPIALADPPTVGQCVSDLPMPSFWTEAARPMVREITLEQVGVTPCTGVIGGEVVAVWPESADAAFSTGPAWRNPCYRSTASFAGLVRSDRSTDLPGAPAGDPVRWRPSIGFQAFQLSPGDVERRAGQDWVACLAAPLAGVEYSGSLRAAFTTGSMPVQFGSCWEGADLDQLPLEVACNEAHPAELLAQGWLRDPVGEPAAAVQQSCVDIAGRIMQTADPTRGGELVVVVDRVNGDVAIRPQGPQSIACFVVAVGSRELAGTVIGLADRPVPLVG